MTNTEFEKLILDHLDIVKIIASKIYARIHWAVDLRDLIHSGILGLIDAARKYDSSRHVKFSTYASLRIRGAIVDELRNLDWASRCQRQKIKTLEHAFEALETQLGRPPNEEEMAKSLGMSLIEFQELRNESVSGGIGVFRIGIDDDDEITDSKMMKYYIDETYESPALAVEKEEMKNFGFNGSPTWVVKVYAPPSGRRKGQLVKETPEKAAERIAQILKNAKVTK